MSFLTKYLKTCLLFTIVTFFNISWASPVTDSSKNVFRIWIPIDLTEILPSDLKNTVKSEGIFELQIPSLGRLVCFYEKNRYYCVEGHGTGFAVDSNHLVTNHHVITELLADGRKGFIVSGDPENITVNEIKVIWSDKIKDLAILETVNHKLSPIKLANNNFIEQMLPVHSIGFPGASDDMTGFNDKIGYLTPKIRPGTIVSDHTFPDLENTRMWEHNAAVNHGNSGGPLVNNCGEVVGVNGLGHGNDNDVRYATNLDELIPALKSNNIKFAQSNSKCSGVAEKLGMMKWLLIGAIAIFAIVILGLINTIAQTKKKVRQGKSVSTSRIVSRLISRMEGDNDEWQLADDGRYFRWDPIKGVVWKNQQDNVVSPSPVPPPSPQPSGKTVNISVYENGHVIGQTDLRDNQSIIVGRSADLRIANSKVSSRHVQVQMSNGTVTLTDMNSTNGTFYNGKRITGSVPLTRTDRFKLANANSTIELVITLPNSPESPKATTQLRSVGSKPMPTITLIQDTKITIGKSTSCDVQISENFVSRVHCTLHLTSNGQIIVEDNNSRNGVFINSRNNRVKGQATLSRGDRLMIVNEQVVFEF